MRLLRLVFALAAFAALGTVSAPMASAGPAAGADRALQREASRLLRTPNGPPGIAITVQRGKRRTFLNGGRAIAGTRRRIRSTDHMRLASTSKAFSGAVALLLVERGQLRLNDTIGQRVPSLPLAWRNVTLRQLLNHTSGVPNYTEAPETQERLQTNPRGYVAPADILDGVIDEPLLFAPGSRYGHTGNFPGYTQFAAVSRAGTRSAAVSVSVQSSPDAGDAAVFKRLRKVYALASCAALARD